MAPPDSRQAKTKPAPDRSGDRVTVLLPLPLGRGYTYGVPADLDLAPGDFVAVPLGPRTVTGVVWDREVRKGHVGWSRNAIGGIQVPIGR